MHLLFYKTCWPSTFLTHSLQSFLGVLNTYQGEIAIRKPCDTIFINSFLLVKDRVRLSTKIWRYINVILLACLMMTLQIVKSPMSFSMLKQCAAYGLQKICGYCVFNNALAPTYDEAPSRITCAIFFIPHLLNHLVPEPKQLFSRVGKGKSIN